MTQPVQEPSQGRTDQAQEFRTRQLYRRPAPAASAGVAMWPMSYELIPFLSAFNGPDGDGTHFFGNATRDATYTPIGFYMDNFQSGAFHSDSNAIFYARLGPKGSAWGINFLAETSGDCAQISWQFQVISENATGDGYDLDGLGLIAGSTDAPARTFYTTTGSAADLYSSGATQKTDEFIQWAQFRIMGDDGDPITSNATTGGAGELYPHFDGGSGIWAVKLQVTGKQASSSDYKARFSSIRLQRFTSDGLVTA